MYFISWTNLNVSQDSNRQKEHSVKSTLNRADWGTKSTEKGEIIQPNVTDCYLKALSDGSEFNQRNVFCKVLLSEIRSRSLLMLIHLLARICWVCFPVFRAHWSAAAGDLSWVWSCLFPSGTDQINGHSVVPVVLGMQGLECIFGSFGV